MATTWDYVVPYPKLDGERSYGLRHFTYTSGLTGDQVYKQGDLVKLVSGGVEKCDDTTAANVTGLMFAGQDYDQVDAKTYWTERGVPCYLIPRQNLVVFTYEGLVNQATYDALVGQDRELIFDATNDVLTVRSTSTNPAVRVLGFAEGALVGDTNPPVLCRILEDALG